MILPSQLKLSNKQLPPPSTKAATPHAVKGATAISTAAHHTAAISPDNIPDKGSRQRLSQRGGTDATEMESFDLKPTKSNSSQDKDALNGIAWGPLGPILVPKNSAKNSAPKKLSRKASNPFPTTSAGGGPSKSSTKPILNSTTAPASKGTTAIMDRTFTRRPNSKESTTSSQRSAVSNGAGAASTSNSTLANSTLANSTTSSSGQNAPVQPNFLPGTASAEAMRKPFTIRWNRKYLSDPQSCYPLPFTLSEMHRQVLRSMLLVSVFGSPLCSPLWAAPNPPPKKILEVGCGTGYWSALCHKHFSRLGHTVSFTGIDIAPLAQDMCADGMQWRFVQHDLRSVPIPFKDEEFDVIMVKDLALISSALNLTANLMEEYFRCLKPGGQMEVWDSDSTIRLLAPHTPSGAPPHSPNPASSPTTTDADSGRSESDDQAQAEGTGTYVITPQTPFKDAQNPYIIEYNQWITTALTKRGSTTMPCTLMGPLLAQEPQLGSVEMRRVAIPFSAMRWEREDESENGKLQNQAEGRRILSDSQRALRETALAQFVMWIDSMEHFLKDAAGKNQEEWDRWYADMMQSLMKKGEAEAGECLEIGAWWATKKGSPKQRKGNSAIAEARRRKEEADNGKYGGVTGGKGERGGGGIGAGEDKPSAYPADPHPGKMWEFPEPGSTL